MKQILTIIILALMVGVIAQRPYQSIIETPLPPGRFFEAETPVIIPIREELSDEFSKKDNMGSRFGGMVRKKYFNKFWSFDNESDPAVIQKTAYEFYQKRLNARVFTPKNQEDKGDIDISKLKDGETSEVVFYPSWWGGGVFKWFVFKNSEITLMSITIGQGLIFVENIYAHKVPIIEPDEKDLGFPKYPASIFKPLESSYTTGMGDFPRMMNVLFITNDSAEQVIAFFESRIKPSSSFLERPTKETFRKQIPGMDYSLWPTLSIKNEPESESTQAYTAIVYRYPVEESGD